MKTIAVLNRKGGTGKTVTAFTIGHGLARKGFRILLVDADSQANLSADCGIEARGRNLMDALVGSMEAVDLIQHTEGGVDLIPGGASIATADVVLDQIGKEYRMREILEPLQEDYDFCLIDNGPALGVIAVNSLTAADDVLIPVQAEVHSLQGIALLMEPIKKVRRYTNKDLKIAGILLTRYNGRANISKGLRSSMEEMAEQIGTKVFRTAIRECVSVREAEANQTNIFDFAPQSNAAADYEDALAELLEE